MIFYFIFGLEMRMKNVATLKEVTMSSEHNPPNHSPRYSVDGKVEKIGQAVECSHTLGQLGPWMLIDLMNVFDVSYVTLVNRLDEHGMLLYIKIIVNIVI